jgi:hypothetical protein
MNRTMSAHRIIETQFVLDSRAFSHLLSLQCQRRSSQKKRRHVANVERQGRRIWHSSYFGLWAVWYVQFAVYVLSILTDNAPGVAELVVFHPVDTIAKRLMSNKSQVCLMCILW